MFVYSSFLLHCWIGCCAVALLEQTRLLFGLPLNFGVLEGFVFAGAIYGYTVSRHEILPRSFTWGFGVLAALCFLGMPRFAQATALIPAVVWTLYYGVQWLRIAPLRSIPMLKPLAIALAWSWVTVLLPLTVQQWFAAGVLVLGRAAFVFALALATDLCDCEYDAQRGLDTLALRLGARRALVVFDSALALSAMCVLLNWTLAHYTGTHAAALLLSLALTAVTVRAILRWVAGASAQKLLIDATTVMQFALVWMVTIR